MTTTTTLYKPAIPSIVRAVVYVIGVIVGLASILAIGLSAVLWPEHAATVAAVVGTVGTATGWLSSVLGVAYRSPDGAPLPEATPDEPADV